MRPLVPILFNEHVSVEKNAAFLQQRISSETPVSANWFDVGVGVGVGMKSNDSYKIFIPSRHQYSHPHIHTPAHLHPPCDLARANDAPKQEMLLIFFR